MDKYKFLISGGSGFIGSSLVPVLLEKGCEVTILSRNPSKTSQQFNQAVQVVKSLEEISNSAVFDTIINLAGQGIADKRWTEKVKQELRGSRINTTQAIIDFCRRAEQKPSLLISGSALGYYGANKEHILDESYIVAADPKTADGLSFSSQLCLDWEEEASAADELGIRTCYLRTGIVLGKNGGALAKMLPPFRLGLGGPIGDGKQWMSWIHLDDLIGIILHLIEHDSFQGAVNGTAPNPVRNDEFSKTLAKVLNRPALLPMPSAVIKLLMGQMGEELLLSGQYVVPKKVTENNDGLNYEFRFSALEPALRDILNGL